VAYKNLSKKSDISQRRLKRTGCDSERAAFRADLILTEFKQIGFIGRLIHTHPWSAKNSNWVKLTVGQICLMTIRTAW